MLGSWMFIVFSPVWALARLELGWNLVLKLLASTAANSVGSLSHRERETNSPAAQTMNPRGSVRCSSCCSGCGFAEIAEKAEHCADHQPDDAGDDEARRVDQKPTDGCLWPLPPDDALGAAHRGEPAEEGDEHAPIADPHIVIE